MTGGIRNIDPRWRFWWHVVSGTLFIGLVHHVVPDILPSRFGVIACGFLTGVVGVVVICPCYSIGLCVVLHHATAKDLLANPFSSRSNG
jgi:hypothetical protein